MHVFHIRGFSSWMMLLGGVVLALALLLALPASFMMVLWNATIFESFKVGPQIDIFQGLMLWGIVAILMKLLLQPEIKFEIQRVKMPQSQPGAGQDASAMRDQQESSETSTEAPVASPEESHSKSR